MISAPVPVLGFAAHSGSGKTTLLEKLIHELAARGLRVALVKHAHHDFDIDKPGKDSYRLRKAGAEQTLVASAQRWALMTETLDRGDPQLAGMLSHLDYARTDLVLVEGFKHERLPKIEVHRAAAGHTLLAPGDPDIIAVASDISPELDIPVLDLNHAPAIADFILAHFKLNFPSHEGP